MTARLARWARHRVAHIAVLLVLVGVAYANVYPNAMQLDDSYRVAENPHIRTVAPIWRHFADPNTMATLPRLVQYRPLLPLSLSLNHAITGDSLAGYHAGNVLLHMAVVWLVYLLLAELMGHWARAPDIRDNARALALFGAALFAVHPIAGITVNYISSRDLQMMAIGLLGACLIGLRMERLGHRVGGWIGLVVCLLLSLLAKKNGVILPALMVAFALIVAGRSARQRGVWLAAGGVTAVIAGYLLAVRYGVGFSPFESVVPADQVGGLTYPLTQLKVHATVYLPLLVWPLAVRQAPYTDPSTFADPGMWLGLVVVVGTLWLAWRLRRRAPLVAFCILGWWLGLALTSSVIPTLAPTVHYRPYLSLIFAALLAALALWRWAPSRWRLGVAVTLVVLLAAATWRHNATWRDGDSLFSHSIRYGGAGLAHLNLGVAWMGRDPERAKRHLQDALDMEPGYILAKINLGLVKARNDEVGDGLALIASAVAQDRSRAQSHYWYAVALSEQGLHKAALTASRQAAALRPDEPRYHYRAALDAQAVEDFAGSLASLRAIERLRPGYLRTGFNIAFALQRLGRYDDAVAAYQRWLKQHPDDAKAWFNLGWEMDANDDCPGALYALRRALELSPEWSEAKKITEKCRAAGSVERPF